MLRYWDGVVWTEHTTAKVVAPQSPVQSASQPAVDVWAAPAGGPALGQPTFEGQQQQPFQGQQQPFRSGPPVSSYGQGGIPSAGGYGPGNAGPYSAPPPAPGFGQTGVYWHAGGPTTPDGAPLAGYGSRVGAYLLDYLFTTIVSGIASAPFILSFGRWYVALIDRTVKSGSSTIDTTALQSEVVGKLLPIVLISTVIWLAYNLFFLMRTGATLGMRICGITVRLRERPGALSFGVALKRLAIPLVANLLGLVPLVSYVASLGVLLDLLWPAWDQRRQALHDKLAGTNVVQAAPKSR